MHLGSEILKHATATAAICGQDLAGVVTIRDDLAIAVCNKRILRVVRGGNNATLSMVKKESLVIDPASVTSQPFTDFITERNDKGDVISVKTPEVLVKVIEYSGQVVLAFLNASGDHLYTQEVQGLKYDDDNTSSSDVKSTIEQSWTSSPDESLYGGGQFVDGFLDYKAAPIHLVQSNLEIAVPFFMSSRGYGILWDSYGETWLNPVNRSNIIDLGLPSPSPFRKKDDDNHIATGTFTPKFSGDYWFSVDMQGELDYFNSNRIIQLKLLESSPTQGINTFPRAIIACHIHEYNIPKVMACKATNLDDTMEYKVFLEYNSDVQPKVFYKFIDGYDRTTIQTIDTEFVDYYLMFAGTRANEKPVVSSQMRKLQVSEEEGHDYHHTIIDSIIASYRELTGPASFFSKKAYGFWQCKEHYHNQTEILDAAKKFRELRIPVDNIVQDWQYWGSLGWGPQWDTARYPEPKEMIRQLHDNYHLNLMVSVWSMFGEQTTFFTEMNTKGLLINGSNWFDPWNPTARKLFFKYLDSALFSIGADAVWLDATEPEGDVHLNRTIYIGSGNKYRNTFSLEVNKAFHEGFVAKYGTSKRPFALTRSSFSGQKRFASVVWSGDTLASFECLHRQIAMSIKYQMSGDPYWTMDIGGFFRSDFPEQYTSKEYQMLLLRWFQFAVFTPIMRLHGQASDTELWNYGKETQSLIVESAIDLRYRLIPYIYSGFQRVHKYGYTMGRAMVFDFFEDRHARNISDQFMFGDSFLVAPIFNLESNRTFYLPSLNKKSSQSCCCCDGGMWRDFYTGTIVDPGHYLASEVDPSSMLVFVKSSIVVLAPKSQHVHDPLSLRSLEVRIYSGRDSSFTLYEDDGIDPNPSRPSTEITFSWSEQKSHLCIGKRIGKVYPGMPQSRKIRVVLARHGHGVGVDETGEAADATVTYDGKEINVDLSTVYMDRMMVEKGKDTLHLAVYTKQ